MARPAVDAETFEHSPDMAWRRIDDEAVVLDLRSGVYYSLNDTAALIWECLGQGLTAASAAERVAEEFSEAPGSVRRDVDELVRELLREKMIRPASGRAVGD